MLIAYTCNAVLAQSAERTAFNRVVEGSSPSNGVVVLFGRKEQMNFDTVSKNSILFNKSHPPLSLVASFGLCTAQILDCLHEHRDYCFSMPGREFADAVFRDDAATFFGVPY